jgi:hypothetical protein
MSSSILGQGVFPAPFCAGVWKKWKSMAY